MSDVVRMAEKHSPGPWCVGHVRPQRVHPSLGPMWEAPIHVGTKDNPGNCHTIVSQGGPGALHSTQAAVEANARLIAAAPDLLEALRAMVKNFRSYSECRGDDDVLDQALAAIAKAEGRS
jgi:hypothetical protein